MRKQIDVTEFGKNTKLTRIELDLTQTQLAQKTNTKQKSISRYETGASLPSIRTLIKITKVLKKSASYFLDEYGGEGSSKVERGCIPDFSSVWYYQGSPW